jgi:hypothetical protein
VVLSIHPAHAARADGQRLYLATTNLLARAFGRLEVAVPSGAALAIDPVMVPASGELRDAATAMRDAVAGPRTGAVQERRRLTLHIGPSAPRGAMAIAARGWRGISWKDGAVPDTFDGTGNPLGCFVASLLGGAALTRRFIETVKFGDCPSAVQRLRFGASLGVLELSAYDPFLQRTGEPDWHAVDLGRLIFSSLGAVNGALLYFMASAGITADITAWEPEPLVRHNLNRYLYALSDDARTGLPKVEAAARCARGTITLVGVREGVDTSDTPFATDAIVVSGADNDIARHAAACRARSDLLSLATELDGTEFSVHGPSLAPPCIGCLHPGDAVPNESQPTHPIIAAWPAVFALTDLVRGGALRQRGEVLTLQALRPAQRLIRLIARRKGCPLCGA